MNRLHALRDVVREVPVDTPTVTAAKAKRDHRPMYSYYLTDADLRRVADLGDAATLAYAAIRSAAWGPRAGNWVAIPPKTRLALNRGYRWWHSATTALKQAGVIDVDRGRGRAPLYRLRSGGADTGCSTTVGDGRSRDGSAAQVRSDKRLWQPVPGPASGTAATRKG